MLSLECTPCENLLRAPYTRHVAPSRDLVRPGEATRGSRCAGRSALRAQASAHRLARIMSCQFDVRDNLDHQTLVAFESTSIRALCATPEFVESISPRRLRGVTACLKIAHVLLMPAIACDGDAAGSVQLHLLPSRAMWMIMCFHAVLGDGRGCMSLVSLRKSKLCF